MLHMEVFHHQTGTTETLTDKVNLNVFYSILSRSKIIFLVAAITSVLLHLYYHWKRNSVHGAIQLSQLYQTKYS